MYYADFLTVLRTARTRGYHPRLRSKKGMLSEGSSLICVHPTRRRRSARARSKAEGGGN
jgi:hypothetical protein